MLDWTGSPSTLSTLLVRSKHTACQTPLDARRSALEVALGPRSYPIQVVSRDPDGLAPFARQALDATWAGRSCRSALIVTDRNLAAHPFLPACQDALQRVGIAAQHSVLAAGEATKSLDSAALLYDHLIAMKADRHTVIVALGGGVIGDLAGFVAATYARGLPLLMVPTSLLAQVDSSVGGKVGVNHPRAKNIIGAFHQPAGVWIDTDTLAHAPRPRAAVRPGRGGQVRRDPRRRLLRRAGGPRRGHPRPRRTRPCGRSSPTAAGSRPSVVSQDEREETGLRAVLNFGHTDRPRHRGRRRLRRRLPARRGRGGRHGRRVPAGRAAGLDRARADRPPDPPARAVRPADRDRRASIPIACSRP